MLQGQLQVHRAKQHVQVDKMNMHYRHGRNTSSDWGKWYWRMTNGKWWGCAVLQTVQAGLWAAARPPIDIQALYAFWAYSCYLIPLLLGTSIWWIWHTSVARVGFAVQTSRGEHQMLCVACPEPFKRCINMCTKMVMERIMHCLSSIDVGVCSFVCSHCDHQKCYTSAPCMHV